MKVISSIETNDSLVENPSCHISIHGQASSHGKLPWTSLGYLDLVRLMIVRTCLGSGLVSAFWRSGF